MKKNWNGGIQDINLKNYSNNEKKIIAEEESPRKFISALSYLNFIKK